MEFLETPSWSFVFHMQGWDDSNTEMGWSRQKDAWTTCKFLLWFKWLAFSISLSAVEQLILVWIIKLQPKTCLVGLIFLSGFDTPGMLVELPLQLALKKKNLEIMSMGMEVILIKCPFMYPAHLMELSLSFWPVENLPAMCLVKIG